MKVRIPVKTALSKSEPEQSTIIKGKSAITHEVQKGETLFSISKKYGLTTEELLMQNPDAQSGLKTGSKLLIYPKPPERPTKPTITDAPAKGTAHH